MNAFFRCLSSEFLKAKRTLYLLAVVAMPTILGLFNFLLLSGIDHNAGYYNRPDGWVRFEHNTITFWAILVLPSLLVLVCAFIMHQEHDTRQWRRLMSLPIPRAPFYLAKMAAVVLMILLSSLILWAENIFWGWLLTLLRPELGLSMTNIKLWEMLIPYLIICAFSLFIAAIHLWFSLRAQNFVLSIGVGLALILAGFFLHEIPIIQLIFPWSLPSLVYKAGSLQTALIGMAYALVGWVVVTAAGCIDFTHRDVLS